MFRRINVTVDDVGQVREMVRFVSHRDEADYLVFEPNNLVFTRGTAQASIGSMLSNYDLVSFAPNSDKVNCLSQYYDCLAPYGSVYAYSAPFLRVSNNNKKGSAH